MSQFDPFAISRRSRQACQQRRISATDHLVLETLLYRCRPKLGRRAQVAGKRLAELAGLAYSTVRRSLNALRSVGLLAWERTHIRVTWSLGIAVRQWRNIYTFPRATESDARPTDSKQESFLSVPKKDCSGGTRPLVVPYDALAARMVAPSGWSETMSAITRRREALFQSTWLARSRRLPAT